MRFSDVFAASMVAPLVAAHGGMPQIHGMPHHLRARNPFAARAAPQPALQPAPRHAMPHKSLVNRQAGGVCGPDNGGRSCLSTECCSPEGNCGNGSDYCPAPDCLFQYGPACDANQTPAGASTRNDARPQLGSVAYGGAGIYTCVKAGEVALTFDDGPYIYTSHILDVLDAAGAKATFFITGNNLGKGEIDTTYADVISRMDSEGHQVASHTWSHQDLNNITKSQVYDQMVKNEMALRNILGKYPTYMRPPYSDCGATCEGVMSALGYHVIYFDLDTDDYDQDAPDKIQVAKDNFKNGIDSRGAPNERLVIGHDIHQQTAYNLTDYMLTYLASQGLTTVTVGDCLGDDKANWYRSSSPAVVSSSSSSVASSTSSPTATASVSTTDGTCGTANAGNGKGYSCLGYKQANGLASECCSLYGYCGNSDGYCGSGCQAGFGKCGIVSASSTSSAPAATASVKSPNGACAGTSGYSCNGYVSNSGVLSECCSSWGYCGNATDYCGTGCQAGYGKCLGGSSSMSSMSSTASAGSSMSSGTASSTSGATVSASSSAASRTSSVSAQAISSSSASGRSSSASSSGSASVAPISASSSGSASARSTSASSSGSASVAPISAGASSSSSRASGNPTAASSSSVKASSAASSYPASSAKATSAPYSAAQASSTVKAYAASSPTPSATVSKNGKCGTQYGSGQTCAGYKNSMGVAVECCCADSGTCSNDSWACGQGCDKAFGNCWGY